MQQIIPTFRANLLKAFKFFQTTNDSNIRDTTDTKKKVINIHERYIMWCLIYSISYRGFNANCERWKRIHK